MKVTLTGWGDASQGWGSKRECTHCQMSILTVSAQKTSKIPVGVGNENEHLR